MGYSALTLARRLAGAGWTIAGTSRTGAGIARLAQAGFAAQLFDGTRVTAPLHAAILDADAILLSAPPGAEGDPVLASARAALSDWAKYGTWLGYLSTTGVFGDRQGEWVDETSETAPTGERGRRRLAAEQGWQDFAAAGPAPLHIFRLPGIYGPGRSVLDTLRAGTARRFNKPGQFFSRIHVDDLAATLAASIAAPAPGRIYNVCDDEPAPQCDVVAYGAELLGLPVPPLEDFDTASATLSDMARSFYRDSKRVRNTRIREELGVSLARPTYREGLTAILACEPMIP
jgi:nucleoside-diphosphate-sugar epimerase